MAAGDLAFEVIERLVMVGTLRIWRSPQSAFGHFLHHPDPWQEETVTALDA
jgi:hypothetical protein